jgi:hypothetical protein
MAGVLPFGKMPSVNACRPSHLLLRVTPKTTTLDADTVTFDVNVVPAA